MEILAPEVSDQGQLDFDEIDDYTDDELQKKLRLTTKQLSSLLGLSKLQLGFVGLSGFWAPKAGKNAKSVKSATIFSDARKSQAVDSKSCYRF